MTDPRQLLDDYAAEDSGGFQYGSVPVDRDDAAPKAFTALRAVLDIHQPKPAKHFATKEDDRCAACNDSEPSRKYDWTTPFEQTLTVTYRMHEHPDPEPNCVACLGEDDSSGEPLTDSVPWPCPTVQAITTALEAK